MSGRPVRVVGIGQPFAGDDALGPAVVRWVEQRLRDTRSGGPGSEPGALGAGLRVELVPAADPTALPDLLEGAERLIIVDAVLGPATPGTVVCLAPEDLAEGDLRPVSSHGFGVAEALRLARAIGSGDAPVHLVGVVAGNVERYTSGLSPAVAAAVPAAGRAVLGLLGRGGEQRP